VQSGRGQAVIILNAPNTQPARPRSIHIIVNIMKTEERGRAG